MSEERFHDSGKSIRDYQDQFLVKCPECNGCAQVHLQSSNTRQSQLRGRTQAAWRLVCSDCGHFVTWLGASPWQRRNVENPSGCGLPLWLRTTCRGRPIWAFNERHLHDLTAFITALHRGRGRAPDGGMSSRSMVASLPRWMIAGKHRQDVGRALGRLAKRLPVKTRIAGVVGG